MPTVDEVYAALRQCIDPELPVSIVDLGLIYDVKVENDTVKVTMTLTGAGCPSHVSISEEVKRRVLMMSGVRDASVEVVWEPQWSPSLMSDAAKQKLGVKK